MMLDAEVLRRRTSDARLIVFLFRKSNCEGLHLLSETADHSRQQRVRINSTAQEQAKRNIGAQAQPETFIQFRPNFVERFVIAALNLWEARKRPIALHLYLSGS